MPNDTAVLTAPTTKPEKELNMVTMTDGRVVEFSGKRKLLKSVIADERGIGVKLDFVNGQTRDFIVPQDLMAKFATHGAEQKLGDEIAGVEDIEDCVMAIDDLIDRLYNGDWTAKRDASAMSGASVLAKALVEVGGKTLDQVRLFLKDKTQAQKIALRNHDSLAPVVARLEQEKAARATKKPGVAIDTDSLLNDLAAGVVSAPVSTEVPGTADVADETAETAEQ